MYPISSLTRARSATPSKPPTRMRPALGGIIVAIMRNSVVLPAPSEPTRPTICPCGTRKETSATAVSRPKVRVTPETVAMSAAGPSAEPGIGGHPGLELVVGVGHVDLDQEDELDPLLLGLDDLGREL